MADSWRFFGNTLQGVYSHLGAHCHVSLTNGTAYQGYLYSVDPETSTLLLVVLDQEGSPLAGDRVEDSVQMPDSPVVVVAVRQHAIKDFSINKSPESRRLTMEDMDKYVPISSQLLNKEAVHARKTRLVESLRSKRIPVESTDDDPVVHIMASAHVRPPYLPSTVDCPNRVISERVKAMVQELAL
ncbi:hypothetical protein BG004_004780 [Podila humilis]|nr:hypothetical protein BG004_004780 [Podila humilis]